MDQGVDIWASFFGRFWHFTSVFRQNLQEGTPARSAHRAISGPSWYIHEKVLLPPSRPVVGVDGRSSTFFNWLSLVAPRPCPPWGLFSPLCMVTASRYEKEK